MNPIILNVTKIEQPIGTLYISTIDAYTLYSMSKSDIIELSNNSGMYDGIQRGIKNEKVRAIKDYLTASDATFPNSIILNTESDKIIAQDDTSITLQNTPDTFTIIDGQHRLKGFEDNLENSFDLIVTFFIDLPKEEQSRVFVTINSEQTKVDPSISFYHESKEKYFTPRKMVADLSILFAQDINSPWNNKIKLIGKKDELSEDGVISLNAFAQRILLYVYNDKKYFNSLRNTIIAKGNDINQNNIEDYYGGSILWDYYITHNESALYKILLNYFTALEKVFKKDWNNDKSLLTKTTGYNAVMDLFKRLYEDGLSIKKLNESYFFSKLKSLEELDGTINTENYGASGIQASKELYKKFIECIYG